VRVLSATHKDLAALVAQGAFRQDLYYRINVIEVRVPPLRERREDIPQLASAYLDRIAPDWDIERPLLSEGALAALDRYDFPGNVRELENMLERAVAMCENNVIEADDLRLGVRDPTRATEAGAAASTPGPAASLGGDNDGLEREAIMRALQETRYNKTKAAQKLGITFRALRYKLKKLAID
jgi:two-component system response regulator PilR (NtrC family)